MRLLGTFYSRSTEVQELPTRQYNHHCNHLSVKKDKLKIYYWQQSNFVLDVCVKKTIYEK